MSALISYELEGKRLSFANWISNLSPIDTPFTSMIDKKPITQTLFQWQTDTLERTSENAMLEGSKAETSNLSSTQLHHNITQIFNKTISLSDTTKSIDFHGRDTELAYQMSKISKEIKRDIEYAMLNNGVLQESSTNIPRTTSGYQALVAKRGEVDPDTGAIVHRGALNVNTLAEGDVWSLTYNLYLAGSNANIIMFHPKHASFFSSLQEKTNGGCSRIFENTPKFSIQVNQLVDPLGQVYKLIPNKWMPKDVIYFFNPEDWSQMILRQPKRTKLAKKGNSERWMIEVELGLRHRNPYASGVLDIGTPNNYDGHVRNPFIQELEKGLTNLHEVLSK